jgi:hypothetical protein
MNLSVMINDGGQLSRFDQKVSPCDFGIFFFDKKKQYQTEYLPSIPVFSWVKLPIMELILTYLV